MTFFPISIKDEKKITSTCDFFKALNTNVFEVKILIMKRETKLIYLILALCFTTILFSCEEQEVNNGLQLPLGGKIESYTTSDGTIHNDITSSIWFFENRCVYLVNECEAASIGSFELVEDNFIFSPDSESIDQLSCESNEDLIAVLKEFSGVYEITDSKELSIVTHSGSEVSISLSEVTIEPVCEDLSPLASVTNSIESYQDFEIGSIIKEAATPKQMLAFMFLVLLSQLKTNKSRP
ncbi:MAG: hypothetical protein Tsb0034_08300 [Ekhidna sp.]